MKLAVLNLLHNRVRFAVTIAGISFSAFLMVFQGSLLAGFLRSASRMVDSIDASLWVTAHGARSFDFATPLPADLSSLVRGVPGVAAVHQIANGLAFWQRPDGTRQTVSVVGAETALGGGYPISPGMTLSPETACIDLSDRKALGIGEAFPEVEINGKRVRIARGISGFANFLGTPYVFTRLRDARRYLGISPDTTMFLVVSLAPGYDPAAVQRTLQARIPEVDVWQSEQFSSRARLYWTMQTGAGGALLTAGLLGFVVGVLVVSQTIYATTMEHIEEFATLKALGASGRRVAAIVALQALIGTLAGVACGILTAYPLIEAARPLIAWIYTPWRLTAALAFCSLLMAAVASCTAGLAALRVEPGRVFRA